MYLKELTIYGFKSFGTKSQLDFIHQGKVAQITAIVGPNGSGKSNIADAVRWVLGEQSSGLLRGKKTEDVIFFGSEKHSRGSYAEIALTLAAEKEITVEINDKKLAFKEIEIARKLYRSGESEYLINRRRARLIDIQQLMATFGFGQSTYSIIGQGMVDRLLFFNPTERKNLFDEAAGIKQHKIKRDLAKKKLLQTEDNLIRLHDLLKETEPQLINLRRLVKRAEGKTSIENELANLIERYFGTTLYALNKTISEDKKRRQETEQKILRYEKKMAEISTSLPSGNEQLFNQEKREKLLRELNEKRDTLIRQLSYLEAQKEQAGKKAINLTQERKELLEKAENLKGEIERIKTSQGNEEIDSLLNETRELENKTSKLIRSIEKINSEVSELADPDNVDHHKTETEKGGKLPNEEGLRLEIDGEEEKRKELFIEIKLFDEKKTALTEALKNLSNLLLDDEKRIETITVEKNSLAKLCQREEEELRKINQGIDQLNKILREEVAKLSPSNLIDFERELTGFEEERKSLYQQLPTTDQRENLSLWRDRVSEFLVKLEAVIVRTKSLTEAANDQKRQNLILQIEKIRSQSLVKSRGLADLIAKSDLVNKEAEAINKTNISHRQEKAALERELKKIQGTLIAEKTNKLTEIENNLTAKRNLLERLTIDREKTDQETKRLLDSKIKKREELREELAGLNREKYRLSYEIQRCEDKKIEEKRQLTVLIEERERIEKKLSEFISNREEDSQLIEKKLLVVADSLMEVEREQATEQKKLNKILEQNQNFQRQYINNEKIREELNHQLNNLKQQLTELAVKLASKETKREDLSAEAGIYTEAEIREVQEELRPDERDLIRARIENLRRKKESIGEVDQETLKEYTELEERNNNLKKQLTDLEAAENDLKKVTEELDRKITGQFNKTFRVIAGEFNRYFALLFNGGRADLQLEEDEEGNLGIEILANPPGKRIQNLATLSGGERALTSLALIFAILSTNPSPFCVLDEVDASLDEVNTCRFVKILTSLAKKTQFLLISHNRETMRVADTLYGITMDESHLSKIISLRLSQALEQEELTKRQ